jgi:uncharacterized repeat protein (TIGR01451 family)
MMAGWLLLALIAAGSAAASTCAPAGTQGAAPSDYQDYCWLDFTGYSDVLAQGAGQPFNYALPDGSTLTFTLNVTTNKGSPALAAVSAPSWSGAAIGQTGFIGIPGNPVLYEAVSGSTVQVVLNNITVTPPPGSGATATYDLVAADGESSNQGESLSFTTNGTAWVQLAQIPNGTAYPTVAGVGTKTVTETGVAGTVGAFAFGSFGNPTQVSSTMVGSGLQGAMFAIRYASVSLTAQFNGARANASDQFTYSIKNIGGQTLASGTSTGTALGGFPPASVPTIAAGYPFIVNEVLAPGSASTLANYAISLTCTNQSTGSSSTVLPVNQAGNTYTFPRLQFGDALSCVFTNSANRANVTVTKTGPASVNAGAPVSYTLVVSNSGPSAANGMLVQDPAVANFTAATVACTAASGGAVCPSGVAATVANLQGPGIPIATLPNGGAVTLVVSGTAGVNNIVNVVSLLPPAGLINSNPTPSATARTTVIASADMASSLLFPASVNAGQSVTGTVLYTNNGPSTASATTFTLTLPANLAVAPTLSGLPAGAAYAYVASSGAVTFTGMPATLASGATVGPITVSYIQPPSGTSTVTATDGSSTLDPNLANNTATATISGVPVADVASKVTFPATVNAGQPVTGTVLYTNNGPSTASATTFTLTLPANLAVAPTLSGLPAGATYAYVASTGVVTFTGMPATLASGANVGPIAVSYIQPPSGTSTVTATDGSSTLDPNLANNTATATIGGVVVADVASKVTFPANVNAGQTVSGTVLYTNNGPSTASATTFTLTLPANLTAAPTLSGLPAGAAYAYVASSGAVTFTGMPATLASGANVGPIAVSYIQVPSGTSVVTATVNSATFDPNLANNIATATIAGVAVADVASKITIPADPNAGQPVSLTVLYTNHGPSTASGPTFSLTLPANLAAAPSLSGLPTGATYAYVASTGVVTFTGMPTTLASGANVGPISVSYAQPPSGTSVVTASVYSLTFDPNLANNIATATITGVPVADVAGKVTFPANVNAGQTVSGTVLYTNNGPSTASGATFKLTLQANLAAPPTLSGLPAGAGYTYNASSGVVTFTGMPTTLASGANVGPITVSYTQPPAGTSTVTATVDSATLDPNPANNTATATITGAAAELMGTVFIDNNQDGVFDSGDTPIAGATVQLFVGTRLVATVVTGATGKYEFTGQASGAYSVVVTPMHGYLGDTPSPVTVTLRGGAANTINFGMIPASADGALVLTKTTPLVNISAGQSVPYTITATNSQKTPIVNAEIVDLTPAGFHFRAGSGSVNGKKQDPTVNGRELTWTHLAFAPGEKKTFTLVLTAGAGVTGGEFVNQASAYNALTHALISNVATATVRIVGDPTFDCPDLIGKVFDDANANGVEDPGEKGMAGVRLVTAQGLLVTTDAQGRYHIACPVHPDAAMGTNFVVKVDERTLPSGYRLTTDNPETVRLTAGKVSKLNFGATIHRVVRVEVNSAAFDGNELRPAIAQQLDVLVASLKNQASIVRLAYAAADESDATVASRLQRLKDALDALWKSHDCKFPLRVEEDIVRSARPHGEGGTPP